MSTEKPKIAFFRLIFVPYLVLWSKRHSLLFRCFVLQLVGLKKLFCFVFYVVCCFVHLIPGVLTKPYYLLKSGFLLYSATTI